MWGVAEADASAIDIVLEGPATFDAEDSDRGLRTLVLACSSEALELRSYKPDFPASIPHITLYDGPPSKEATAALRLLSGFPWGLKLHTALDIHSSSHDALQHSSATDRDGVVLTAAADRCRAAAFRTLGFATESIAALTLGQRLALIEAVAEFVHRHSTVASALTQDDSALIHINNVTAGQLAFWSPEEVWALTGEGPRHRRSELQKRSAFATPPELARDVATAVTIYAGLSPNGMVDFGDPAFGNGVLYAAAREAIGADRINSARVVEIDEATARSTSQRWSRSGISVLNADFLGVPAEEGAWSMVLANPPYRRSQDITQNLSHLRAAIAERTGISVSARSDLYVYFLLQADAWLRQGGIAAWILPSEFQVTSYGVAIRRYLSTQVELLRIHTYDARDPLFDNALASTCVVIFRKRTPSPSHPSEVTFGGTLAEPGKIRHVPARTLAASARWSFAALDEPLVVDHADDRFHRLGELFDFSRGIATGANSYFVLDDTQLETLSVDRRWVRPLIPRARHVPDGQIFGDDQGDPLPRSGRWLIDTSATVDEIGDGSPEFADYLRRLEAAVGDRFLVARRPSPFKQERREPAPFLFVYMAKTDTRTPRFLVNYSRAVHLNNMIGMYPKPRLWELFSSTDQVYDALRSITVAEFELAGRSYGNGLLKLEPRELRELPLKSLS